MLRRAKAAYFFYGAPPSDEALRLQIKLGTRDGEPPDNAAVQIQAHTRRAKANPNPHPNPHPNPNPSPNPNPNPKPNPNRSP